jgi:hypothetical protein
VKMPGPRYMDQITLDEPDLDPEQVGTDAIQVVSNFCFELLTGAGTDEQ